MLQPINEKNIGRIIKRMRMSAELTQAEFGSIVGHSNSAISKFENGNMVPSIMDLCNFASSANCQISIITKIPEYSQYRNHIINVDIESLGDFEFSESENCFARLSDRDKHRIVESLRVLLRSIESN